LQRLLSYCSLDICKVFEVNDKELFGDLLHNLINVLYFLPQTHIEKMSGFGEISQNDAKFIHDNVTRDTELLRQLNEVKNEGDVEKVLAIYLLRSTGFQQASELIQKIPLSIGAQAYVNQMKAEMEMQFKMYVLENSLKDQFTSLTTRIESLEADMKKVKEFYPE
jgi:hypothetical protein